VVLERAFPKKCWMRAGAERMVHNGRRGAAMVKLARKWMQRIPALVGILATPLSAEPPALFAPTTPWAVNGDDGRCRLSRTFSDGARLIELTLEEMPLALNLRLSLRDTDRAGKYVLSDTDLRFDDSQPPVRKRMIESFDSIDGIHRVHAASIGRKELDRVSAAGALTLAPHGHDYVSLRMPNLAGALSVLNRCEDVVIGSAGLTPEQLRAIKTMAWPIVHGESKPPAYITHADKGDLEDIALAGVTVSPAGLPTDCKMIHRAKSSTLDGDLCAHALAQKYDPALDAQGHPITGIYFAVRTWQRFMKALGMGDEYFTP
jgi:hypothetical protein